nr:unnamed protein product [Callosobruchus chinensis]
MQENGKRGKAIALDKGHTMPDGTPYITVIVDGGWSKRSYGHGCTATSGVKPLFLGVRNKVCSFCLFYEKKNIPPKKRVCFKNFSGSSTAMEQDIIVEGFRHSVEQHELERW